MTSRRMIATVATFGLLALGSLGAQANHDCTSSAALNRYFLPAGGTASSVHQGESDWYSFYYGTNPSLSTGATSYVLHPVALGTAALSVYTGTHPQVCADEAELLCAAGGLVPQCVVPGVDHFVQVSGVLGMRVCDSFILGLIGCLPLSSEIPYVLFARPAVTV